MSKSLRIGILGASSIAPIALIEPALQVDGLNVVAIAARDVERAKDFAERHHVPRVFDSYGDLIDDPDIDAVYVGLPPAAHAHWSMAAVGAGKHVLCEKPLACNEREARRMVMAAKAADRVLCEGFHWRYHPLANRVSRLAQLGVIGRIQSVEAAFCAPIPDERDFRHDAAAGGGAMMDLGCYAVQWARLVGGGEPDVITATAVEGLPGIDLEMVAQLLFPNGVVGKIRCSMSADTPREATLRAVGDEGELQVNNPLVPQYGHRLRITNAAGTTDEQVPGDSTYVCQLRAFASAIRNATRLPTGGEDALINMRVIDKCYRKAGLSIRGAK